jgi:hypothetical protein
MKGAMTQSRAHKHYRCRYCGTILPAWLPVAKRPDGAILLHHLSQQHPEQVGLYLKRMRTEDIGTVAAEAFGLIEEDGKRSRGQRRSEVSGGTRSGG